MIAESFLKQEVIFFIFTDILLFVILYLISEFQSLISLALFCLIKQTIGSKESQQLKMTCCVGDSERSNYV